jgi:hypothetical protein
MTTGRINQVTLSLLNKEWGGERIDDSTPPPQSMSIIMEFSKVFLV